VTTSWNTARGIRVPTALLRAAQLACLGLACGSETDDAPEVPLCDGSAGLTLRVFYEGGGQPLGSAVRLENGAPSFAVDGRCGYFISGGWAGSEASTEDYGWRSGRLDPDLRRMLERTTGKLDLESLACGAFDRAADASSLVIANTRSAVSCATQSAPAVSALLVLLRESSGRLWQEGQPLAQDLHVSVWEGGDREEIQPYSWPSALPLRDYFEPPLSFSVGGSKRVLASNAPPLRDLRERFLTDRRLVPTLDNGEGILVTDGEVTARLFMRDALPYEDDRGLWPLPGE
jgi:hypothetical protein